VNGWTEGGRIRGVCVCVTSKEREIGRASNKRVSKRETRDEEEGEREREEKANYLFIETVIIIIMISSYFVVRRRERENSAEQEQLDRWP